MCFPIGVWEHRLSGLHLKLIFSQKWFLLVESVFNQTLNLQFDSSCGVGLVALLLHLIVKPCKLVSLELDCSFCCQWWTCRWSNYSSTTLAGRLNSVTHLLRLCGFCWFWKRQMISLIHRLHLSNTAKAALTHLDTKICAGEPAFHFLHQYLSCK